jgi:uncharacterized protein (TIRG00374 family)
MTAPVEQAAGDASFVRRQDLDAPPDLTGAPVRRRLLALAVVGIVLVGVIVLVPGLAGLRDRLEHGNPGWLLLGGALKVLSAICFSLAFSRVFCRRMRWGASLEIGFSELGANAILPIGGAGGLALGAWALRRSGMDARRIARRSVAFFFLTSVPNVLGVIILGLALALHVVAGRASLALTLLPALIAAAGVLATVLAGHFAASLERRVGAARGADSRVAASFRAFSEGVKDALELLREADLLLLVGLVGYLSLDVMILWATFHAFGFVPPLAIVWIGYLLGELGGLIPVPGGVGGVDLGLVGALVLYHVPVGAATAAVLGYRALALLVPALLGGIAFVRLRRSVAREAIDVAGCGPGELVEIVGVGRVLVKSRRELAE